jgi:hypothetical protein
MSSEAGMTRELWWTLQEACNHLWRVPRQIGAHFPAHAAIEKGRAVRLLFGLCAREGIKLQIGLQA